MDFSRERTRVGRKRRRDREITGPRLDERMDIIDVDEFLKEGRHILRV